MRHDMNTRDVVIARNRAVVAAVVLPLALAACAPVTRNSQSQSSQSFTRPAPSSPAPPARASETVAGPRIAIAADGAKIAYDVAGTGPALLLVHGGGQTRQSWQQLGYVDRLKNRFTVITLDLRGHGDSDKPLRPDAYNLQAVV